MLLTILAAVFFGYFALRIVLGVVSYAIHAVLGLVVPLAIVGVVALVLYTVINRKALGSGRRTLP